MFTATFHSSQALTATLDTSYHAPSFPPSSVATAFGAAPSASPLDHPLRLRSHATRRRPPTRHPTVRTPFPLLDDRYTTDRPSSARASFSESGPTASPLGRSVNKTHPPHVSQAPSCQRVGRRLNSMTPRASAPSSPGLRPAALPAPRASPAQPPAPPRAPLRGVIGPLAGAPAGGGHGHGRLPRPPAVPLDR